MSLDNVDSDSEINLIPSVRFTRSVNRKFASAESVHPDTLLNKGLLFERKRSRLPKKISLTGSEALLIENTDRLASVDARNFAYIESADTEVPVALIVDIDTLSNTDTAAYNNNTKDNSFYDQSSHFINSNDVFLPVAPLEKSVPFSDKATISHVVRPQDLSLTTRIKNFFFRRTNITVNPIVPLEKHFLNSTAEINDTDPTSIALNREVADLSNIVHFNSTSLLFNEFDLLADSALDRLQPQESKEDSLWWESFNPTPQTSDKISEQQVDKQPLSAKYPTATLTQKKVDGSGKSCLLDHYLVGQIEELANVETRHFQGSNRENFASESSDSSAIDVTSCINKIELIQSSSSSERAESDSSITKIKSRAALKALSRSS